MTAPARILLAWELGHGWGHVLPLRALAEHLIAAGHQVFVAARDLLRTRRAFAGSAARVLAAPFFPGLLIPAQQQNSLADVIWFDGGGHTQDSTEALFLAWRELLQQLRIDLLIADAAPMAIAAAHGLTRRMSYDNCFHATDVHAWSIFRDWERIDANATQDRARRLLTHLNAARSTVNLPPAESLAAGFSAQRQLLRFLPELDHAGPRAQSRYIGQTAGPGCSPNWPEPQRSRRVLAYVRKDHPLSDRVINALVRLPEASVLCFHDGLAADKLRSASHVSYSQIPYALAELLPQAHAVVCNGGGLHAMATQFGLPTLVLPMHTEQFLAGRMGVQAGVSLMHVARGDRPDVLPMIKAVLNQPEMTARAQAIAKLQRAREPDAMGAILEEARLLLDGSVNFS